MYSFCNTKGYVGLPIRPETEKWKTGVEITAEKFYVEIHISAGYVDN
jgi:hypothetical protein